jgi:hypothetical protein
MSKILDAIGTIIAAIFLVLFSLVGAALIIFWVIAIILALLSPFILIVWLVVQALIK